MLAMPYACLKCRVLHQRAALKQTAISDVTTAHFDFRQYQLLGTPREAGLQVLLQLDNISGCLLPVMHGSNLPQVAASTVAVQYIIPLAWCVTAALIGRSAHAHQRAAQQLLFVGAEQTLRSAAGSQQRPCLLPNLSAFVWCLRAL